VSSSVFVVVTGIVRLKRRETEGKRDKFVVIICSSGELLK
jgi:hypothetical protein